MLLIVLFAFISLVSCQPIPPPPVTSSVTTYELKEMYINRKLYIDSNNNKLRMDVAVNDGRSNTISIYIAANNGQLVEIYSDISQEFNCSKTPFTGLTFSVQLGKFLGPAYNGAGALTLDYSNTTVMFFDNKFTYTGTLSLDPWTKIPVQFISYSQFSNYITFTRGPDTDVSIFSIPPELPCSTA